MQWGEDWTTRRAATVPKALPSVAVPAQAALFPIPFGKEQSNMFNNLYFLDLEPRYFAGAELERIGALAQEAGAQIEWAFACISDDSNPARNPAEERTYISGGLYPSLVELLDAEGEFRGAPTIVAGFGPPRKNTGHPNTETWTAIVEIPFHILERYLYEALEQAAEEGRYSFTYSVAANTLRDNDVLVNPREAKLLKRLDDAAKEKKQIRVEAARARASRTIWSCGLGHLNHVDPTALAACFAGDNVEDLVAELSVAYPQSSFLGAVYRVCGKGDSVLDMFEAGLAPERRLQLILAATYARSRQRGVNMWGSTETAPEDGIDLLLNTPFDDLIIDRPEIVRYTGALDRDDTAAWVAIIRTSRRFISADEAIDALQDGDRAAWRDLYRLISEWTEDQIPNLPNIPRGREFDIMAEAFGVLPEFAQIMLLRGGSGFQAVTFELLREAKRRSQRAEARS